MYIYIHIYILLSQNTPDRPRTQQTLLFQCFLLFLLPVHNKLYLFNAFMLFLRPAHNKLYLCQYFPAFSASRTQQSLLFQCSPAFSASRTQTTLLLQCFPAFLLPEHNKLYDFNDFLFVSAFWRAWAPPAPLHH